MRQENGWAILASLIVLSLLFFGMWSGIHDAFSDVDKFYQQQAAERILQQGEYK